MKFKKLGIHGVHPTKLYFHAQNFDTVRQNCNSPLKIFGSVRQNCYSPHKNFDTVRQNCDFRHKISGAVRQNSYSPHNFFNTVRQNCNSLHKFSVPWKTSIFKMASFCKGDHRCGSNFVQRIYIGV